MKGMKKIEEIKDTGEIEEMEVKEIEEMKGARKTEEVKDIGETKEESENLEEEKMKGMKKIEEIKDTGEIEEMEVKEIEEMKGARKTEEVKDIGETKEESENLEDNPGKCSKCQNNIERSWCHPCNSKRFQNEFGKWTSENREIDDVTGENYHVSYMVDILANSIRAHNPGKCSKCQNNIERSWCHPCNSKRFQNEFGKWTSENREIDDVTGENYHGQNILKHMTIILINPVFR
ncbi:hypothetical protein Glove_47g14 [Diversispora epigaea]|uniref:Uncharacterized protein n=1 Tax=Diversispora epigaea TaxID=1348612 RepID=A0A397JL35_9GLOM|nr:hypothetical protein Glove_47g14 [Diversispora epigaea]